MENNPKCEKTNMTREAKEKVCTKTAIEVEYLNNIDEKLPWQSEMRMYWNNDMEWIRNLYDLSFLVVTCIQNLMKRMKKTFVYYIGYILWPKLFWTNLNPINCFSWWTWIIKYWSKLNYLYLKKIKLKSMKI